MIFVTVGTNEARFDRLVNALDALPPGEPVVLQTGASSLRPARAQCVEFLSFEALVDHVRRARAVITHAGVGSIMTALANGKRPIVVPRLHKHGEAVDDHQLELGRRLAQAGLVTLVEDPSRLAEALGLADEAPPPAPHGDDARLADDLRGFLTAAIRPAA